MPRTKENRIDSAIEKEIINKLLKEFNKVDSENGLNNFFKKFLTPGEKDLIFRRIAIIKLLSDGKKYNDIKRMLKISDNTISKSVDIMMGRGYGQNPDRKRVKSNPYIKQNNGDKKIRKYKGAESITSILSNL